MVCSLNRIPQKSLFTRFGFNLNLGLDAFRLIFNYFQLLSQLRSKVELNKFRMERRDIKHMKPIGVETPKTKRPSFLLTTQNAVFPSGRRNSKKPVEFGFSPKVKELIQRMRFRLKIHMWLRKARESIEDHVDF